MSVRSDPGLERLLAQVQGDRRRVPLEQRSQAARDALANAAACIGEERAERDRQRVASNRVWAAMMLAETRAVCASIVAGRPVRVGNLDSFALRRALRGQHHPEAYITVTASMLDAITEAGALPATLRAVV
jgi:hypothetical protein